MDYNNYMKPFTPRSLLGIVAHPDDLEFSIAGSVAKWANEGAAISYFILTDGSEGTADRTLTCARLSQIRQKEQRKAARVLGVKNVIFGDYIDGQLENSMDLRRDIVRVIRQVRPEVVTTFDPSMIYAPAYDFINHPDHRAAGQATLDAVFPFARDHLAFPELLKEQGLEPHKVETILLNNLNTQNFFVDITDTLELKLRALYCHHSQITSPEVVRGLITRQAMEAGEKLGVQYAEGFIRIDIA